MNGRIAHWRTATMHLITFAKQDGWTGEYADTSKQYNWAKNEVFKAMQGLQKFKQYPITLLNKPSIRMLVEGVDTVEITTFLYEMVQSSTYEILAYPHCGKNNDFIVKTRFHIHHDMKNSKLYTFGLRSNDDIDGSNANDETKHTEDTSDDDITTV